MANLITSVPAIEAPNWDVYFKPLLADPKINALPFQISIGNMPREVFFNTNIDKITGAKSSCGWSFKGTASTFTKKTLSPIELQAPVEQCYTVLLKKLFGDNLPDGARRGELSPEVINFMTTQQSYAFNRDLLSIVFLGNTGLTADDYYSLLDGVYEKLADGVAALDGTVDASDSVTLNATNLNTTNFFTTMKAVYDLQSRQLKGIPNANKVWIWTRATYDAYISYLLVSTQQTAGVTQTAYVTGGLEALQFLGIPIVVMDIVDERLETDFTASGSAINPYRTILTDPRNHIIMLDGNGFMNADVIVDRIEDKVYALGSCLVDYEYGYGDLNVICGF